MVLYIGGVLEAVIATSLVDWSCGHWASRRTAIGEEHTQSST